MKLSSLSIIAVGNRDMAYSLTYRRVPLHLCRRCVPQIQLERRNPNISILVAIGVGNDGYREIIGDKNLGIQETIQKAFPDVRYSAVRSIFTGTYSLLHQERRRKI